MVYIQCDLSKVAKSDRQLCYARKQLLNFVACLTWTPLCRRSFGKQRRPMTKTHRSSTHAVYRVK